MGILFQQHPSIHGACSLWLLQLDQPLYFRLRHQNILYSLYTIRNQRTQSFVRDQDVQSPGRTQLGETGNVTHKTQHKMAGHRDTRIWRKRASLWHSDLEKAMLLVIVGYYSWYGETFQDHKNDKDLYLKCQVVPLEESFIVLSRALSALLKRGVSLTFFSTVKRRYFLTVCNIYVNTERDYISMSICLHCIQLHSSYAFMWKWVYAIWDTAHVLN